MSDEATERITKWLPTSGAGGWGDPHFQVSAPLSCCLAPGCWGCVCNSFRAAVLPWLIQRWPLPARSQPRLSKASTKGQPAWLPVSPP